jgi:hypothetical protein
MIRRRRVERTSIATRRLDVLDAETRQLGLGHGGEIGNSDRLFRKE